MLKATLVLAALGLAHAGLVPQQYVPQGPAPTYIAAPPGPALPPGLAQQARALPPIYRTAAPVAAPQQAVYRAAPVQYAPAPAAPVQYAPAQYAPAPVQYAPPPAAPAPSAIQDYQRQALAAQRVVQARPQPAAQAAAQPALRRPAGPQQPSEEDYDPNPAYNFSFDVKDDLYTNYQNRKESREGDQIKGSYSVVDSDGFIRTVTYTADPVGGFKAEVIREPTDIKVLVPTPAPAAPASQRIAAPARAAPQQYAPAPQQYAAPARAAPQQYAPAPQYAAAPQQYQQYQPAQRVAQPQAYQQS